MLLSSTEFGLAQLGPAQGPVLSCLAQPSQHGLTRSGSAQHGMTWRAGTVQFSVAQHSSAWHNLAQLSMGWQEGQCGLAGPAQLNWTWFSAAQLGWCVLPRLSSAWHDTGLAQLSSVHYGMARGLTLMWLHLVWLSFTQCSSGWVDMDRQGWHGSAQHSMTELGLAQFTTAWPGLAQHSMVLPDASIIKVSLAQHSSAWHSSVQHSSAVWPAFWQPAHGYERVPAWVAVECCGTCCSSSGQEAPCRTPPWQSRWRPEPRCTHCQLP